MTKMWHFLFAEPFRWIFLAFFQPRRFEREFETQYPRRLQRFSPLLRLIIPMALTPLPFTIIGRAVLLPWHLVSPNIADFFFYIAFGIAFVIGVFRVPFYLASGPSAYKAYYASRYTREKVFDYLRRCSLYWDERVYLPLPYLKQTLLIAYNESSQKALEEIAFIVAERPQQIRAARAAVLEIVVREVEQCDSLEKIARIADWLTTILPPETKLVDPRGNAAIARVSDASRDAMRAIAPIGLQGRRKALDDLQANLRKVYPNTFRDQRLNARLVHVIERWRNIASQRQEELMRAAQDVGNIDNPYKPGQQLALEDSLFVGRRDLAKELEGALSLGSRRPTFLLNGEKRMGKTSVLQQLPKLLGSRYISVFNNLQGAGIYASTEAFLGNLAEGIQREMEKRAMPVKPLQFSNLREKRRASTPAAYRSFEAWLDGVETVLREENRILLLTFDEFEMLEEAEQARYMDIRLLLNWMRSIIQFHSCIALLFSGTKTFDEMGKLAEIDWTGYFNNVQMLRVSFLHQREARHLILKPTPTFPGETLFPSHVVETIIVETGCHPLLVQAVCSALVTLLNVERREQATHEDVPKAVEKALEGWGGHFANLWNRTDETQRACLEALLAEKCLNQQGLIESTGRDGKMVRRAVQSLLRRDLIRQEEDGSYQIAVPMFRRWMEENV